MKKQKFYRGHRVLISDLAASQAWHPYLGHEAIVEHTHQEKYGGSDNNSYSLVILDKKGKPINSVSWYYSENLTKVKAPRLSGEKIIHYYLNRHSNE